MPRRDTSVRASLPTVLALILALAPRPGAALTETALETSLDQLVLDGNDLLAEAVQLDLTAFTLAGRLANFQGATHAYALAVTDLFNRVTTALQEDTSLVLTPSLLSSLQTLINIQQSLAAEVLALSGTVVTLAPMVILTSLDSALYSMLRLSDDIGSMAGQIGIMADRILVMADNIGVMADRILATQVIQNQNVAVVVDAMLQTQQNMILLFATFF